MTGDKLTVPYRVGEAPVGAIGTLVSGGPLTVPASMAVREAATVMTERGVAALVVLLGDQFGVLTDVGIRVDVVASGVDPQTPVGEIVGRPVPAVAADTPVAAVLALVLEQELTCVPVVDTDGTLIGAVTTADLLSAPAGPSLTLRRQIALASSVSGLQQHAARIPYFVADLVRRGQPAHEVSAIASLLSDAVVRRALDLVCDKHDLDPAAIQWMSLGSNARRDAVLSSDVDSAVAFADEVSDADIARFRQACAEVLGIAGGGGLAIDVNGVVASKPWFSRRRGEWHGAAQKWMDSPLQDEAIVYTSLLLDARPIWGSGGTGMETVLDGLRSRRTTMGMLLAEALTTKARLRTMRDVLSGKGGTFDIKEYALAPLTDIARWAALFVGSDERDTRSRLRAAAGSVVLPGDQAATLIEVFEVLQRVRLNYQVAQFDRGEQVMDLLEMKRLSPLERSLVAQAVREIAGVQRRLDNLGQNLPVAD
ncbi:MAG: putative nucleotidyltransferase substrate binding domain-containing protein [Gordonia amarae]